MKKLKFNIKDLKVDNFKSQDVDESKLNAITWRFPYCEQTLDLDRCETITFCPTEDSRPACNPSTTTSTGCTTTSSTGCPVTSTEAGCTTTTSTGCSTTTSTGCNDTRSYPCETFPIRFCFETRDGNICH